MITINTFCAIVILGCIICLICDVIIMIWWDKQMFSEEIDQEIINKNKRLIEKYPFLKRDVYEPYLDIQEYEFTWLDDLEHGWFVAFGEDLCKELYEAIKKDDCEDTFGFDQIKEKFAQLRLYAHGYDYNKEVDKVLQKYEELSAFICGYCGKPAKYVTKGWYYPLCEDCIKFINGDYKNIEEFYDFESYNKVLEHIEKIKSL